MYKIELDEEARMLTITLSGFWDVEMTHRYMAEVTSTVARLRQRYERFDILVDQRDWSIQSAEVIKAFTELTEHEGTRRDGRVAILTSSILSKLQGQRIPATSYIRRFLEEKDAREWLADRNLPDDE